MLEEILVLERALFLRLNGAHSSFADQFMWLYSGFAVWIPVVICFFVFLFYTNRSRWKEVMFITVAIAVTITLCDQFASSLCKPYFARFRPTYHPDFMNDVKTVFDYRGGRYGFISSHAANGFGFATITSLIFRNKTFSVLIFLWATISAYSRIYLGVHFISDVIPGILSGLLFGWIVYQLFVFAHKRLFAEITHQTTSFPNDGLTPVLTILIATVVLIAAVSLMYAYGRIPALLMK
jgi:undecaprenyl-diphosphatase